LAAMGDITTRDMTRSFCIGKI
jgi:hypothetical protein